MRRLFSNFATGWPGIGLLLLRVGAGVALLVRPNASPILHGLAIAAGVLLFAGLWTPVASSLAGVLALAAVFSRTGDIWTNLLLAILCSALSLLGPGFWSVDAKLFGWKRIELPEQNR